MIDRVVKVWSAPGEIVYSPFGGIGSEGYMALLNGRKFIGCELKESYWRSAVRNLDAALRNAISRRYSIWQQIKRWRHGMDIVSIPCRILMEVVARRQTNFAKSGTTPGQFGVPVRMFDALSQHADRGSVADFDIVTLRAHGRPDGMTPTFFSDH